MTILRMWRGGVPHPLFLMLLALTSLSITQSVHGQERAEQLRKPFWLQGRQMRRAFVEIVKAQRESTVQIFSEDDAVAFGAIVEADGWVLTKASQINKATLCELTDGRRLPFEYVGYDLDLDLALLKLEARDLPAVEWAEAEPQVGHWMITMGIEELPVGVGVMSVARRKIPGSNIRGVLGIKLDEFVNDAVIEDVFPNSGAEAANLKPGDQVLKVGDTKVLGRRHLIRTIGEYRPGDTVVLEVQRGDELLTVDATLTHPFGIFLSRIAFQEQMGTKLSFRRDNFPAVYQHDTVLEPEQCGGPVLNLDGKTVGINIARAGRTRTYVLPADLIVKRLDELKSGNFPPPGAQRSDAEAEESSKTDEEQNEGEGKEAPSDGLSNESSE